MGQRTSKKFGWSRLKLPEFSWLVNKTYSLWGSMEARLLIKFRSMVSEPPTTPGIIKRALIPMRMTHLIKRGQGKKKFQTQWHDLSNILAWIGVKK